MSIVMDFLNTNSGAIQTITTTVLVIVTLIYVILTARLSKAAENQLQFETEAKRTRWTRLDIILEKILLVLEHCPKPLTDSWARNITLWTEHDIIEFETLTSEFIKASQEVATVITTLRRLKNLIDSVRGVPPKVGYDWRRFPTDEWEGRITSAISQIKTIQEEMKRSINT